MIYSNIARSCGNAGPGAVGPAAELVRASKVYPGAEGDVTALGETTLAFPPGELALVRGPSGSGKTTLLSLLGCVTYPTTGCVRIAGACVPHDDARALAAVRRRLIGFVFQAYNLLAPLTAEENVRLPLDLLGVPRREGTRRAGEALARMGLAAHARKRPAQLSGGQQQRVAIARAVVTAPPLVLCDEPTAALDHHAAARVMEELAALARSGTAVVVVTHDPRLDAWADRTIDVADGCAADRGRRLLEVSYVA